MASFTKNRTCAMIVYVSAVKVVSDLNKAKPLGSNPPTRASVCVARPGLLATNGVHAPFEAIDS